MPLERSSRAPRWAPLTTALLAATWFAACTQATDEAAPPAPAVAVPSTDPGGPGERPEGDAGPAAPRPAARPQLSEGERRAILEARNKRARVADGAAADGPSGLVVHEAPPGQAGVGRLRPDDVKALADDPAARGLPDPRQGGRSPATAAGDGGRGPASPERPTEAKAGARTEARPEARPEAPAPRPAEPPSGPGEALRPGVEVWPDGAPRLIDLAIATEIKARKPVGVSTHYKSVPDLLMCFTAFGSDADTTVTHVWRHGDRVVSRVELSVGRSPSWRTWSRQRLHDGARGAWSCEVVGPDGQRLGVARVRIGP